MKKISIYGAHSRTAIFLQILVVIIGISAFTFMLWEPHLEGGNIGATPFEIYFKDPFLAYAYAASIFFFVALYQVFKLLGYIGQDETFSQGIVKSLHIIKNCATILIAFALGGLGYLFIIQRKVEEDIAGGVFMGLLMIAVFGISASVAARFERKLRTH